MVALAEQDRHGNRMFMGTRLSILSINNLQLMLVTSQVSTLGLDSCLNKFGSSECVFICMQRIRELEDRIDLQRRQIKDIEEKVDINFENNGNLSYCNDSVLALTHFSLSFYASLVFVPLSLFLFSIYSLALIQVITEPHQVKPLNVCH